MLLSELPDPQITAVEWRQGKPGHIQCTITTTDTAITWIKDGVVVNSYSKGDTFDMIVIRNLTTADSGNYKCIARNRAGIRSVSKQMTVYGKPTYYYCSYLLYYGTQHLLTVLQTFLAMFVW